MKIDIRIFPNETQKFVLVQGTKNGEKMTLLWGNPNMEWHKDIVEEMLHAHILIIEVLGGGILKSLSEEKTIYIWGKSSRYGDVPTETISVILKESFPDYSYFFKDPYLE